MPLRTPHYALRILQSRSGFTLVEVVTVALVLGILAAAAAPAFVGSLMYHRVESAAVRLKNDLELARQTAITKSATHSLQFTTATAYRITNLDSLDHPGQPYQVDLAEAPYTVDVPSVDFSGLTSVDFNGHGIPSSAGTIVLQAGEHGRQVDLDAQGNVTITTL